MLVQDNYPLDTQTVMTVSLFVIVDANECLCIGTSNYYFAQDYWSENKS